MRIDRNGVESDDSLEGRKGAGFDAKEMKKTEAVTEMKTKGWWDYSDLLAAAAAAAAAVRRRATPLAARARASSDLEEAAEQSFWWTGSVSWPFSGQ